MKRAFVVVVGLWVGGLLAEAPALQAATCPASLDWDAAEDIGRGNTCDVI